MSAWATTLRMTRKPAPSRAGSPISPRRPSFTYSRGPNCRCRLCIRDTPGVNDTFMIREQITIRAIRESRICVVVLAAHQALSSVDLALIRMIANVKSREVIIVVNRVDELPDPVNQVPEIRDSIVKTLTEFDGPKEARDYLHLGLLCECRADGSVTDALDTPTLEKMVDWSTGRRASDAAPTTREAGVALAPVGRTADLLLRFQHTDLRRHGSRASGQDRQVGNEPRERTECRAASDLAP